MAQAMEGRKEAPLEEACENLFNYAIQREEIKELTAGVPEGSKINPVTMEYEIQILKIVSVGWGISYFMPQADRKPELAAAYWEATRAFAGSISTMASAGMDREIDYFQIVKDRVDLYVKALNVFSDVKDPGPVIGHTFAKLCGDEEDMYAMVSGKRVFHLCLAGVKDYLEAIRIV